MRHLIETNEKAEKTHLFKLAEIINNSALNVHSTPKVNLVNSVGFLIYINSSKLALIYENL